MSTSASACSLGEYYPDGSAAQTPVDVAVAIPTLLRPCIADALRSVYAQEGIGRIQILVGADLPAPCPDELQAALAERPANVSVLLLTLPYSTSVRHGGVHHAMDGGALRSILSFIANSRYVAYLDDDNSWSPHHLAGLRRAIEGKVWAYSLRMLIDADTGEKLAVDRWDSVGVDRGRFAAQGGFVDTNCLMIDKVLAARALGRWSEAGTGRPGLTADRNFFAAIRQAPHGRVDEATVSYGVRPTNILRKFLADGIEF